jgi:putative flavoprotein involved in K+ transport
MNRIDTVIIGGGQAGLALSRSLTVRGVEHVVLERGRVGERWRSERWDSLRLLTPRWQSRLPGWGYDGPDPDGYMSKDEVVDYLEAYAASFDAPVRSGVTVRSVTIDGDGFQVDTDLESWRARNVVVATGDCQEAIVPGFADRLPTHIHQAVPTRYRNPDQLPEGGVLVVGASSTGLQLAVEIRESRRPVTLSVGRHARLPRTYRGRDILSWLDGMGVFDERFDEVADLTSSRQQPSLQLVGTPERRTLDLGVAQALGIRLVGRTRSADGPLVTFEDNLVEDVAAADLKLARLLMRIDEHVAAAGLEDRVPPPPPFSLVEVADGPATLDLEAEGIRTVLWATGFRRSYDWLHVPVLDGRGEIVHDGGVTRWPGLYVMGLRFLRRRGSTFIDGQKTDAEDIADHLRSRGLNAPNPPRHHIHSLIV